MKTFGSLIFLVILAGMESVFCQIILEPVATGSRIEIRQSCTATLYMYPSYTYTYTFSRSHWSYNLPILGVCESHFEEYRTINPWRTCHYTRHVNQEAGLEFEIHHTANGSPFPVSGMTAYNWKAYLTDLRLREATHKGVKQPLHIMNMTDTSEDGLPTGTAEGSQRIILYKYVPDMNLPLRQVDVTEWLREDLFGDHQEGITTGFMLCTDLFVKCWVRVDEESPRIKIVLIPTPAPTDTPTGEIDLTICCPDGPFSSGDEFYMTVTINNRLDHSVINPGFFNLLQIDDLYWFYPSWNRTTDYETIESLEPGLTIESIIEPFFWPDGAGVGNAVIWTCLVDSELSHILGSPDYRFFSWK